MNACLELIPNGSFVARPDTVGTDEAEVARIAQGIVTAQRQEEIAENMRRAAFMLNAAPLQGRC